MKLEITGTVTKIGIPKTAGKSQVREIILNKKYHDADTGELRSEDDYPVQIWEDDFKAFEATYGRSAKMKISGFINGRKFGDADNEKCFMNFVGKKFATI